MTHAPQRTTPTPEEPALAPAIDRILQRAKAPLAPCATLHDRAQQTPRLRLLPSRAQPAPDQTSASGAGLIVITGPPMSGKGALGHYLHQYLPRSVHISHTDPMVADLRDERAEPLPTLLDRMRSELRLGRKVIFSARLASASQRQRVLEVAQEVGVPRLLVEVEGTDPEALERAATHTDTMRELRTLLGELQRLLQRYEALSERAVNPVSTIAVPAAEPVEEQIKAVLDGWNRLGSPL